MARELRRLTRHALCASLLLALGIGNFVRAQDHCPGCDCPRGSCYTPICDCRLPTSTGWCQEMLRRLVQRLDTTFRSSHLLLPEDPPPVLATATPEDVDDDEDHPSPAPSPIPSSFFSMPNLPRVKVVAPQDLAYFGGEEVQGYFGGGCIFLSKELSRRVAVTVLGHELGHAWQAENHPRYSAVEPFLAEGFAEWMAYHSLRCYGDGESLYKLRRNHDAVYGAGLQFFLGLERRGGPRLVFEVARTWIDSRGTRVAPPTASPGR